MRTLKSITVIILLFCCGCLGVPDIEVTDNADILLDLQNTEASIEVKNGGDGLLFWTATSNNTLLSVSPENGMLCAGATQTVSIVVSDTSTDFDAAVTFSNQGDSEDREVIIITFSTSVDDTNQVADQIEVTASPTTITLDATKSTTISLGLLAVEQIREPAFNSKKIAGTLLTDSVIVIKPDDTAEFGYSDLFKRNFRGREQDFNVPDAEEPTESLLDLDEDYPKPKVLIDLYRYEADLLAFNDKEDLLWFKGDLIYKFDLSHPIETLRFSSADGMHKTVVGQFDGSYVTISVSTDDENWTTVWKDEINTDLVEVDEEVTGSVLGWETLYLKFSSDGENALSELHISAELSTASLTSLLSLDTGSTNLTFSDAEDSSHRGVVFWKGEDITASLPEAGIEYPASNPTVTEDDTSITILFPEKVGIVLQRDEGITSIQKMYADQREILSAPQGISMLPPALEGISPDPVEVVDDWAALLQKRADNDNQWSDLTGRTVTTTDLDETTYISTSVESDEVIVSMSVDNAGTSTGGLLEWVFSAKQTKLDDHNYSGIGWKVRTTDLDTATYFSVTEPVNIRYGDWSFAQTWGQFLEGRLDFATPFHVNQGTWFGDIQPFFFSGGPHGLLVSYFDEPAAAPVEIVADAGRLMVKSKVPFKTGETHETPLKYWLWTDDTVNTKWEALDEWTAMYDAIASSYREEIGLNTTEPKPTLIWIAPPENYLRDYRNGSTYEGDELWLNDFATNRLPQAAQYGMKVIYLQIPWEADAEHHESEYLPGSMGQGSGHAPWYLEISKAIGGVEAMKNMIDTAHDLGIKIIFWSTPSHLSMSSPLVPENLDWVLWAREGYPDDFGWGDIVGLSLYSGYFDYAVEKYGSAFQATGFDGIWQDSFLTIGVRADYSRPQPVPQLERTLALQKEIWDIGLTEVHIEGCGPLGLSSGGYGYETYTLEDSTPTAEVRKMFERIEGREYGLYRCVADTLIEAESYYRALASKGVVGVANLDLLQSLTDDIEAITQANKEYMQVLEKMEIRHLIGSGNSWQGVAWTREGSEEVVLFAFKVFSYSVAEGATIQDITAGTTISPANFKTTAWHTYSISQ